MGATIRAELSKKNKYWVEKNRYYELKYFCLQYPFWKKQYEAIDGYGRGIMDINAEFRANVPGDPTGNAVRTRSLYFERMELVEQAAIHADPDLASYILTAVTEGLSYNYLKARLEIPCGRDMYYDRYRRFFWLLDQRRD